MEDIDADKDNDGEDNGEDGEKGEELEDTSQTEKMSNHDGESDDNSEREWPRNRDEDEPGHLAEEASDKTVGLAEDKPSADVNESDSPTKPKSKVSQKDENLNGKKKVREGKPFTKVVIRRLPPSMSEEVFLDQVSPLPSYDYFYFVSASSSFPGGYSRAYINFTNQNDLFDFTRTFDNYVFIDNKGHEYAAIVEFAPYQRVPKNRAGRKKDTLVGTLESDPVYLTFKEQLQAEALENSRTSNKQHYFETEINESEEVVTTPLLEFLKQKRAEKDRIREERREDRKRKEADRKLLKTKLKDKSAGVGGGSTTNLQQDVEIKVLQAPKEKKDGNKERDSKRSKHKEREERFVKAENRSREFKNKGGKSYREERLKQAEKREEKKRKDHEEECNGKRKDEEGWTVTAAGDSALTTSATVDNQMDKDDDKLCNDKKKWKYGSGSESKRTFTRRREEKKKEIFERKRNAGKSYRSRKGSGELPPEDNRKRNESSDNRDKSLNTRPSPDKLNTKKDSIVKDESTDNKDNNASSAQKSSKNACETVKEGIAVKEQPKRESTTLNSGPGRKEKLDKESSVDSEEGGKTAKDPRAERRIRNKDRPSIEIYRPGMGKFSRQRLEKEKTVGSTDESPSHSPSPTPNSNTSNTNSNSNNNNKPV